LKILFILGFSNPFPGAGWTRIGFFAEAWSKKGHSVEVLGALDCRMFRKKGVQKIGKINIFDIILRIGSSHPLVFILNVTASLFISIIFLMVRKPNIVLVSVPPGDVGLGALLACQLTKTKCIVDYRDRWEDYAISTANTKIQKTFYQTIKKLMMKLYSSSVGLVTVVPANISYLKKQKIERIRLVPNGADIRIFKPMQRKKNSQDFRIVFVGGVGPYYRLDVVVEALELLVTKRLINAKLFIVGGERKTITNILQNCNIKDKIVLLGEISNLRRLSEIIAQSDVGVIPLAGNYIQAKIALPVKFFEYCACGIPVVATVPDDSILAKLIKENKIGITIPPMDKVKLAEAIHKIYECKSFRETASKRARLFIENNFDRNKISDIFLRWVEQGNL
jgi:glycosyltransferase involved in cell wall biosynthesis